MNILVYYIDVSTLQPTEVDEHMKHIKKELNLSKSEREKGKILKVIFVPVRNQGTRVEILRLKPEHEENLRGLMNDVCP